MRTVVLFLSTILVFDCAPSRLPAVPPQSDSRPSTDVALQDEVDAMAWSGPYFNRAEFRISMRDAAFEAERCVGASTKLDAVVPYVTFQPSGDVTDVHLENIPDGTSVPCLTAPFVRIRIDPFSGPPVQTHWSFATIHRADANRRAMINR